MYQTKINFVNRRIRFICPFLICIHIFLVFNITCCISTFQLTLSTQLQLFNNICLEKLNVSLILPVLPLIFLVSLTGFGFPFIIKDRLIRLINNVEIFNSLASPARTALKSIRVTRNMHAMSDKKIKDSIDHCGSSKVNEVSRFKIS